MFKRFLRIIFKYLKIYLNIRKIHLNINIMIKKVPKKCVYKTYRYNFFTMLYKC